VDRENTELLSFLFILIVALLTITLVVVEVFIFLINPQTVPCCCPVFLSPPPAALSEPPSIPAGIGRRPATDQSHLAAEKDLWPMPL
jgi:hypothetical protein